jgi:hypothetical protein
VEATPQAHLAVETRRTVLRLAGDERFLHRVAPAVHANWRRVKAAAGFAGDERLDLAYSALGEEQRRVTLRNLRADLLAVALVCSREPARR